MIVRLVRLLFTADVMGILLILSALAVLTSGVAASVPGALNTQYFFLICLAAAVAGFGGSKTRRNGTQASAGIAALGFLLIWIVGARLTQPLLNLLTAIFSTLNTWRPNAQIDMAGIQAAWQVIADASAVLVVRLQTWLVGFNENISVNDPLIRSLFWILVHWLVSAWLGWFAEKRNALVALLPALTVLTVVMAYSERRVEYLLSLLIILLLLMGIWHYKTHTILWQKTRVDFSESISIDLGSAVVAITFIVSLLAAVTPSLSWNDLVELLHKRNDNDTAEMLGIQRPVGSIQASPTQSPSMPRDHLLTGGFANSEKVVMIIFTGELPPVPTEMLPAPVPQYYWRNVVYDQYMGTGWASSLTSKQSITANTPLLPALLNEYHLIKMDVQMVEPEGRIFWSGTLFSLDVPFTAQWRIRPTSDLFANQTALIQADLFAATSDVTAYHAETYIPAPSLDDLRSASTEYPEDIFNRYLVLPRDVPERVRTLAFEITEGIENPYDKAKAIETYLRKTYPYDLEVPAPPSNQDVTDYFLFDLKKGYCDYYATAMVVLARSNGLPARFVSGYSPGLYDAPNARYVIRELNAHSWAEVYFPEIGWVEFEPTASLPEIERTAEEFIPLPDDENQESAAQLLTRFRLEQILLWLSPLLGIFALAFLYFTVIERWLTLRLEPSLALERIYQNFYRAGRPLTGAWKRSGTSSEYHDTIIEAVNRIKSPASLAQTLRQLKENASALTHTYQNSLFIDYHSTHADALRAWQILKRLRHQLWLANILIRWNKLKRNK
ncbi:MAG: hypothetical protein RIR73_1850 [Chloroflexota bacterium]